MTPILPKSVTQTQGRTKETPQTAEYRRKAALPRLFVIIGIILLATQLIPLSWSIITGASLSASSAGFMPVTQSFLQSLTSVTYIDPGAAYFESIVAEAKAPVINTTYKKDLKLTIAHANINNVTVATNITGTNAGIYDEVLKHGVAHLKGTPLPGDPGTTVIYGHSGIGGLLVGHNNPEIIFSRLDSVSIGDTMSIMRDGKELRYLVSGKKLVDPQDLSFMENADSTERAVLLTCWPLGIGTKRLIIIADRVQ